MLLRLEQPARWGAHAATSVWRRRIVWTGLVSTALHAGALAVFLLLMQQRPVLMTPADLPATVELVMSPPGTDHNAQESAPQPPTPPATTAAPQTEPPPPDEAKAEPVQPAQPAPEHKARAEQPAPQPAQHQLTLDTNAVESDTNALVTGDLIMPATPDVKFHNRKPSYPLEAARRGEHGAVILLIHVAPDGLVTGADVMQSTGSPQLDQAARDAVLSWHFLPSVKDGEPIATDVPMRIVFALD